MKKVLIFLLLFLTFFQAINELKESLRSDLQREPSDGELAARMNIIVHELRRHMKVGEAARNKLIKVLTKL
jgi:DNA-directed RNA polymerase specialized sigma subunit